MITAFASAAHGYDLTTKGVIMAAHAAIYAALACWLHGLFGLAVVPIIAAWWLLFRGSKQAKCELDCMDRINAPHPSYLDVLKAHYYTGFLTILALRLFNYSSPLGKRLGWNNGAFWDCRRPTEFATGFTLDLFLMTLIFGGL